MGREVAQKPANCVNIRSSMKSLSLQRWLLIIVAVLVLAGIYLTQNYPFTDYVIDLLRPGTGTTARFVWYKLARYILNDGASVLLIHGLFGRRDFTRFAMYVMVFGLLVLLPGYIILHQILPHEYNHFLMHWHRFTLNPVLMMLLVPAFVYQLEKEKRHAPQS